MMGLDRIYHRPVALSMGVLALVLGGILGGLALPFLPRPALALPQILVETRLPGMPAAEVRSLVTLPLEASLRAVRGLETLSSLSRRGRSLIMVDLAWGQGGEAGLARVREVVEGAWQVLPQGVERPLVVNRSVHPQALMRWALDPVDGDPALTRRLVEEEILPRLRQIEGLGSVAVLGGRRREIRVEVQAEPLAARGLSILDLVQGLQGEHQDLPLGSVTSGTQEVVALARGRTSDTGALGRFMLAGSGGGAFALEDVARVREAFAPPESLAWTPEGEVVLLEIFLKEGADPRRTARGVEGVMGALPRDLGPAIEARLLHDASVGMRQSLDSLALGALLGVVAATLAMGFFLGDRRLTLLVGASIPLALAGAVAVLAVAGKSLNAYSLGGMALAVGMISDNAVVVAMVLGQGKTGESPGRVVASVLWGTLGSTVTTALVFVPVIFFPGPLGALYGDLAWGLLGAVGFGWVYAIVVLPAWYQSPRRDSEGRAEAPSWYQRLLGSVMARPVLPLLMVVLALVPGILLLPWQNLSLGEGLPGEPWHLELRLPSGRSPEAKAALGLRVAQALEDQGLAGVYGYAGAEDDDVLRRSSPAWSPDHLHLYVPYRSPRDLEGMEALLEPLLPPGSTWALDRGRDPLEVILGLEGQDEAVVEVDDPRNPPEIETPGLKPTHDDRAWEVVAQPRPERMALLQANLAMVAGVLQGATEGLVASTQEVRGETRDIRVVLADREGDALDLGAHLEALARVPAVRGPQGMVPAGLVLDFAPRRETTVYRREDGKDVIRVSRRDGSPLSPQDWQVLEDQGLRTRRPGASAFARYGSSLALMGGLVLVLLYLYLGAQFSSFVLPALILLAIPFGVAGAGPVLALSGLAMDTGVFMGLLVLGGVAVNNAILLYEASHQFWLEGAQAPEACIQGASSRWKAVWATTLSTILALVPLVFLGKDSGQQGMALTLLGGLAGSTVLTLGIFPLVLSTWLQSRRRP